MNEKGFRTACSRLGVNALGHYRLGPRRGVSAVAVGLVLGGEGGRRRNVAPSPAAQDVRDERLGDAVAPRDLGLGETAARVLGADGADPVVVELGHPRVPASQSLRRGVSQAPAGRQCVLDLASGRCCLRART